MERLVALLEKHAVLGVRHANLGQAETEESVVTQIGCLNKGPKSSAPDLRRLGGELINIRSIPSRQGYLAKNIRGSATHTR